MSATDEGRTNPLDPPTLLPMMARDSALVCYCLAPNEVDRAHIIGRVAGCKNEFSDHDGIAELLLRRVMCPGHSATWLRVGDEVPVRWLDGAGYHHARGVVTPADGELKSLRVVLRPPGRRDELPAASVIELLREARDLINDMSECRPVGASDLLRRIDAATAEPEEGP